jgi:BirA family biotin operon repressor/biotin-[acetyl-CoA-carboxylase] ligase
VERTGSTNADLISDDRAAEGDWLVALHQDSGRGRQGRSWDSAPGNFHGSTRVVLRAGDPPAQSLSLAAGLALIEALDAAVPGQPLMLKWPNDVLLLGRKLAGILLERSGDKVVIGFGANLGSAPDLPDRRAATLAGALDPRDFAPYLADSFERLLGLWRTSEPRLIAQAWLARAHPVGTRLTVHSGSGASLSGRFDGLEADGALRLRREDGALELVRAADVEL